MKNVSTSEHAAKSPQSNMSTAWYEYLTRPGHVVRCRECKRGLELDNVVISGIGVLCDACYYAIHG